MKILVGSVTNKEPEILRPHLEAILAQELPSFVSMDFYYLTDPSIPAESLEVLDELVGGSEPTSAKPVDAEYSVSDETHHWNKPTFYWLGAEKQRILDKAKADNYDAVFMVDTDLICDSGTLASLVNSKKEVVSGVFWTKWSPDMPSLPQVWMEHPYEMQGRGVEAHEHLRNAAQRQLWEVAGLGACTLIRKEVLGLVRYSPKLEGLPENGMWQGEDRTFCVLANRNHVRLWADGWPSIYHVYRPGDVGKVPGPLETFKQRGRKRIPELGDLVSAKFTPVEEGNLAGWSYNYRGKLSAGSLLGDMVQALKVSTVGADKFIQVKFPVWWEIPEYRNQVKTIRVELLDVREDLPHPGSDAMQDFGVFYEN